MGGKVVTINAPISGTFYRRPSPEEAPYVEEGDEVNSETVVCIVESMKVFNEVRAEVRGVVKRVLVEDEEPVKINQPLFEVELMAGK